MNAEDAKNRSKTWMWIAGCVVAVAVIAGVWGLLLPPAGQPEPSTAPTAAPSTEPSEPPAAEGPCDVPGGDITAVPEDLRWESVDGISWPASDSLGPVDEQDGFPVCFSRSPVGAALAATTIFYSQVMFAPSDVADFYFVESAGKAAAIAQTEGQTPEEGRQSIKQLGITVAGFRVDEYTPDRALVRVVLQAPNTATGYVGRGITVVWEDGDWRVKPLDNGSTGNAVDVNDGQFTEWTG